MRLQADSWLTGQFGYPVFRVDPDARDAEWRDSVGALESVDAAFAFARVDVRKPDVVGRLCGFGFHVVDVTIRLTCPPRRGPASLPDGVAVRPASAGDFGRIIEIAGSAFRYSRFHLDPRVPRTLADQVKRAWMESYRDGTRGSGCLVVTVDNVVHGFLAIVESIRPVRTRTIDLVAIGPDAQGRGLGRALVESFIVQSADLAEQLDVSTQAANSPSVRLYETLGFRFSGASYVLHGHFGRTPRGPQ